MKKSNPLDSIPEATEQARGEKLVAMLNLKEAKITSPNSRRAVSYDPPRYDTAWGTKTALGLFRSVGAIIHGRD